MLLHYLKVAARNLLKYKTQSIISMVGLAVGFACISLSAYWNYYEVTYDSFQPNVERIYRVRNISPFTHQISNVTPGPLAEYLADKYPEVEMSCAIRPTQFLQPTINEVPLLPATDYQLVDITPQASEMFGIEWITGNKDIETWGTNQIAIAEHVASLTCNNKPTAIGQKLVTKIGEEFEIVAVFKTWPNHSNFKFDMLRRLELDASWNMSAYHTYVMLKEGTNHEDFLKKVTKDSIQTGSPMGSLFDIWTPLKDLRHANSGAQLNVKLEDVKWFTGAALLVVVCALLNYLTLFISRIRNMGRNMALRTVYGSSGRQMSVLLMTEYLLLLLMALMVSMLFIEISYFAFQDLSQIEVSRFKIYEVCIYLIIFVIVLAALLSFFPIWYFKRKTLLVQLQASATKPYKNSFRLTSVCIQLSISILCMFCSTVMIRQVNYLAHSDINIQRKQIAWLSAEGDVDHYTHLLKQLPFVKEAIPLHEPLFPVGWGNAHSMATEWDGKATDTPPISYNLISLSDSVARFYGLKMKEGSSTFDTEKNEVIINETMARKLNMENPVGKQFNGLKIKGVIYDFQNQPPTTPIMPMVFSNTGNNRNYVAFTYEGNFRTCEQKIAELFKEKGIQRVTLRDGETVYNEYIQSETNLLKLLGSITVVSLCIALFGIYALIVQSCERHRKKIAIRKVNGAHVSDILGMFFKQYMLQVVVASVIAFPIGYLLMIKWLENYTRQIEIGIGTFAILFVAATLLVTLCITYQVWKAANENPADVVKSE